MQVIPKGYLYIYIFMYTHVRSYWIYCTYIYTVGVHFSKTNWQCTPDIDQQVYEPVGKQICNRQTSQLSLVWLIKHSHLCMA